LTEALRAQIGKPIADATHTQKLGQLAAEAKANTTVPAISRGWVECLARVAAPAAPAAELVDSITTCGLPDHLRLPLLAELVTSSLGDAATRRAAMRVMLAHDDPRVRAAGLSVIASTWKESDPRGQQTIVSTITGAIASKNPIVASAAIDAADALYDELAADSPHRTALDNALVTRGAAETDVELATQLYTTIGKRTIAGGGDACRAGLTGHPVRVKAAVECLRELGEAIEMPALGPPPAPPNDVATVIGHRVTWHLATSRGDIDIELRPDVAPWAVATVVALTQGHYYDGLELHRVVPNFVAQGGDATQSGYGSPGFMLPAEPASAADGPGFMQGGVGMADSGPDSAGSQWFVMHSYAPHLDGRYTWIGSVKTGQKSADALVIGDRVEHATVTIE
jgi:peptidylprolyl isomerase